LPSPPKTPHAIWYDDATSLAQATRWSQQLGLPLTRDDALPEAQPLLVFHQGRLELHLGKPRHKGGVFAEFSARKTHAIQRQEGKNGLLARAIGLRKHPTPRVLDATAGLGQDGFLLACHGCRVQLCERSTIIAALLEDGLERGLADPETAPILKERMQLHAGDAGEFMRQKTGSDPVDVVYLDPMFTKSNHAALAKKEMQWLRLLVGQDEDAPHLLDTAIAHARRRVVVKRSLKAPVLGGRTPHCSIQGTTIRYDVYLPETPT